MHKSKKKKIRGRNILGFAWRTEEDGVKKLKKIGDAMEKKGFNVRLKTKKKTNVSPTTYILTVPRKDYRQAKTQYLKLL